MWFHPTLLVLTALTLGMETISSGMRWPDVAADEVPLVWATALNLLIAGEPAFRNNPRWAAVFRLLQTLLMRNLYLTDTFGWSAICRKTGDVRYTLGVLNHGWPPFVTRCN